MLEVMVAAAAIPGVGLTAHTMLRAVTNLRGWRARLMMRDDMAQLFVPTLFAWGDADMFAPPSSGHDMAARMPNARLEVIADAGHLPYLDRPEAVADAILGFMRKEESLKNPPS